jgi:hypothetical protein
MRTYSLPRFPVHYATTPPRGGTSGTSLELGVVIAERRSANARYRQEFALGDAATGALELDATSASAVLVLRLSAARTERSKREMRRFIMERGIGQV